VELLRFYAGDIEFAVAARGTKRLHPDDPGVVHVCELLGLASSDRASLVLDVVDHGRVV